MRIYIWNFLLLCQRISLPIHFYLSHGQPLYFNSLHTSHTTFLSADIAVISLSNLRLLWDFFFQIFHMEDVKAQEMKSGDGKNGQFVRELEKKSCGSILSLLLISSFFSPLTLHICPTYIITTVLVFIQFSVAEDISPPQLWICLCHSTIISLPLKTQWLSMLFSYIPFRKKATPVKFYLPWIPETYNKVQKHLVNVYFIEIVGVREKRNRADFPEYFYSLLWRFEVVLSTLFPFICQLPELALDLLGISFFCLMRRIEINSPVYRAFFLG